MRFRMFLIILSAILGSADLPRQTTARVDLLEVNRVSGFDQVLFWDWSPDYRRYHCQGWALQFTVTERNGKPTVLLPDGRVVQAPIIRYTETTKDPERENAKLFPPQFRRKLW